MLSGIAKYIDRPGYLLVVNAAPAAWELAKSGDTEREIAFYAGPNATKATVRNLGFNRLPEAEGQTIRISYTEPIEYSPEWRLGLATMFTTMGINVGVWDITYNNGQITVEGQVYLPRPTA